jgi:hypothetical protein
MGKLAMTMLLGILCINFSIFLVNEYVILPQVTYITPVLPGEVKGGTDINGTLTPVQGSSAYQDPLPGANKLWRLITTMVAGIPVLLADFNVPVPVALVLDAIYTFILGIFFIEFLLGRNDILD